MPRIFVLRSESAADLRTEIRKCRGSSVNGEPEIRKCRGSSGKGEKSAADLRLGGGLGVWGIFWGGGGGLSSGAGGVGKFTGQTSDGPEAAPRLMLLSPSELDSCGIAIGNQ